MLYSISKRMGTKFPAVNNASSGRRAAVFPLAEERVVTFRVAFYLIRQSRSRQLKE